MRVQLKVQRFNPETNAKPYWQTFALTEVDPTERMLDLLLHIKGHMDGALTFRHSCAHGVCGSDAMRINHVNRLACKTLVQTLAKPGAGSVEITVQPLLGLPLVKDLVVDMDPFFDHYRSVQPFFIGDQSPPITGLPEPTRAFTLTGLTNYTPYTVTLNAVLDSVMTLTDTVTVMPTDIFAHLPVLMKEP